MKNILKIFNIDELERFRDLVSDVIRRVIKTHERQKLQRILEHILGEIEFKTLLKRFEKPKKSNYKILDDED
ncbi:hypothetical protein AMJ86_00690 [bacterium SM23_57]|nr:MAG: hypothetical protein AMJ86_00690 [bacterium SM23_57]